MRCRKPRILLLRPNPPEVGPLGDIGIVAAIPIADIAPVEGAVDIVRWNLESCDWLVLTSPRAPPLLESIRDQILALAREGRLRVAVVGPKTGEAVERFLGVKPSLVPAEYRGEQLARALVKVGARCVLVARSERGVRELVEVLEANGVRVVEVHLYRVSPLEDLAEAAARIADSFDYIVLTSPLIAQGFLQAYKRHGSKPTPAIVAIGPTTAKTVKAMGYGEPLTPSTYTLEGVAELIRSDWASRTACR